jgi:long-chain acyl-CoA synthetase
MYTPADIPMNLGHVHDRALQHPDREALVDERVRLNYGELDERIRRAQTLFRGLGVTDGDRVSFSMANRAEIVIGFFGLVRIGGVFVGLNTILAVPEKAHLLEDSGARILVTDAAGAEMAAPLLGEQLDLIIDVDNEGPEGWAARIAASEPMAEIVEVSSDHPAGIAYTSGTTGNPKGVVHSHHNLMIGPIVQIETRGYGPEMRRAEHLSLNILNVITMSPVLVGLATGLLVVIPSNNPRVIVDAIKKERITHYLAIPPIAYVLVHDDDVTSEDFSTVIEATSGSAQLADPVLEGFKRKFGLHLAMTFGQTEAPMCLAMEAGDGSDHIRGSSGTMLAHIEMFAADEDGHELPVGTDGELWVRPARTGTWAGLYTPMLEYWGNPKATADTVSHGNYCTGDIGHVDAEGRVFIIDRKSIMVNRGGANIYPAEVERVLDSESSVAASAVFGIPDERLGQRLVALVEAAKGAHVDPEHLRALCADELARYKVPDEIYEVSGFARNSLNKIVRAELPKQFEEAASQQKDLAR